MRRRTVPLSTTAAATAAVVLGLAVGLVPGTASADYPGPGVVTGDVTGVHDPTMIRGDEGYLLYSTHEGPQGRTSTDRIDFQRSGAAFDAPPDWWSEYSPDNDPWAPDISRHDGRYLLYYAVSTFGSSHSAIGLATSETGRPGTWTDRGVVHRTDSGSGYNAIDPELFVDDDGRWWLAFGSFWSGLKMIELEPATGKQHPDNDALHSIAARPDTSQGIEAPTIVKRDGRYYLFASYDRCCAGTDSTYNIRVGRADSPTGPYVDKNGTPMTEGGGSMVLETHGNVIGPGGQDVMHDSDGDLLVYHYYDGDAGGVPTLGLNLLDWNGGWPTVY